MKRLSQTIIDYAERAIGERLIVRRFAPADTGGLFIPTARTIAPNRARKPKAEETDDEYGDRIARETGWLDVVINTAAVDRHDTIVDPRGVNLTHYLNNPVLQYQHGCDNAVGDRVMGKVKSFDLADDAIGARVVFDLEDAFAAELFRKYSQKWMRGFSIGFIPHGYAVDNLAGESVDAEGRPQQTNKEVLRYTAWDLVELSCVAVPSNPEALAA